MKRLIRRIRVYFETRRVRRFLNNQVRKCRELSVSMNRDIYLGLSGDGRLVCSDTIPELTAKGVGRRKRYKAYSEALQGLIYWRLKDGREIEDSDLIARADWYTYMWLKSRGL